MVFKREEEIHPSNLPKETIYRFIELEINEGINSLSYLLSNNYRHYQQAQDIIINHLAHDLHGLKEDLRIAFDTLKFRKPTRDELVQYFRYKYVGVAKIAKIMSIAPNTITKYKEHYPSFTPVFPSWETFPVLLKRWNDLKPKLNLFNEELIHLKNNYDPTLSVSSEGHQHQHLEQKEQPKKHKLTKHAPLMDEKEANALYLTPFTELGMVKFAIATRGYLPSDYIPQIESGEIDISEVARYLTDAAVREKYQKD